MHQVAIYYFDAGSLDLIATNSTLLLSLVGGQACLVSLYSFLWGIFAYPKVRRWVGQKAGAKVEVTSEHERSDKAPKENS